MSDGVAPRPPAGDAEASPAPAPPGRPRRVRLEDVATQAGVTKSVASRVLNDDPSLRVRAETRARVRDAAAGLGYRPHAGARSLAVAQAKALALLIPDLTNATYARIARGAFRRAMQRGYVVLLAEDTGGIADEDAFTDLVSAGRVDGLLVASAVPGSRLVTLLTDKDLPHVFVNRAIPGSGRNVTMDVRSATAMAVAHLVHTGHRVVGHVAGPPQVVPAAERQRAFLTATRALGVERCPVEHGDFSGEGGYLAVNRMLDAAPDVDAVFVSTLTQSVGVLRALGDRGLDVPGDVAVLSFDELPIAAYLDPPLTTLQMPLDDLGSVAVDALLDQVQGGAPQDVVVAAPPLIVHRSSA